MLSDIRTEDRYKFVDKGKALQRLIRFLYRYEKDNLQQPAPDKAPYRWIAVPTDRVLTLAEWCKQIEQLNRLEAEKRRLRGEMDNSSSKTTERGMLQ